MDTFSPDSVSSVSTRLRRMAVASATSLVAVSLFIALPVSGASPQQKRNASNVVASSSDSNAFETASPALITEQPKLSLTTNTTPTADIFALSPTSYTPSPKSLISPNEPTLQGSASAAQTSIKTDAVTTPTFELPSFNPPALAPVVESPAAPTPQPVVTDATPATVKWTPAAPTKLVSTGLSQTGGLTIGVNRTTELKTNGPVKRVSVGQPDIADIQAFADNLLLVTAKKAGTTQVIVWDENNQSQSIDVNVEIPLDQLKDLIGKLAPGSNIELSVANDTIVLRGQAPNLTVAKQIGDVAGAYGKVQNFIEVAGGQTVAVQVQFAEVSRSVTNSLGVNWGFQDGTSVFGSVPGGSGPLSLQAGSDGFVNALGVAETATGFDLFGVGRIGNSPFAYFIKALRENNLLRVLQEPNLTTTSGEPASFLAGGQVAVPVPADNGSIGIEYKEFGVRLLLTPIVLGNGKIRLVMEAESSDLDYANGTTIQSARVPGLRTRRVQSSVEMGEGQTMSVAGLLDDSVIATRSSIPGLGDLPVLGQLFRSTRYQRKETELVILITPRLASAMNPDQVTSLPGANWRHPQEIEQLAFGDLGGNAEADAVRDSMKNPSARGLKASDRTPRTTGNPLAAGNASGDQVSNGLAGNTPASVPAPMFIGEHGFAPVRDPNVTATPASDSASVHD